MMRISKIKIVYILLISLLLVNISYASEPSQEEKMKQIIEDHKKNLPKELNIVYDGFKEIVANKSNFENVNFGWSYFNDNNRNLIIGSSGVVYCGNAMTNEGLAKYGFDLVGFGGIFDSDACELLRLIKDKEYDNIVLFGGVNDLNLRANSGFHNIDMLYCNTLIDFVEEAKKHLRATNSNIYYVKIKPMLDRDSFVNMNSEFISRYNSIAFEINYNIDNCGFKGYDIPFDTTNEYSELYIHYNNKVVFETMFDYINSESGISEF